MSAQGRAAISQFALDVAEGFLRPGQKKIAPLYFYDELGSALFDAITLLPEYGLTRADERLIRRYAADIILQAGPIPVIAEIGSGSGKKTRRLLEAVHSDRPNILYRPIDISRAALEACERELSDLCTVRPICADWTAGLSELARERKHQDPMLVLFLGSSIGNLDRPCMIEFLKNVRFHLRPGDSFLVGADLVKDVRSMLAAYDDPTGVTAAFNLNILGRINRDLSADFDLRSFAHEVRWNQEARRIEMHLVSCREQTVFVGALNKAFTFQAGETIWTESSHKFEERELAEYASATGFHPLATWVDRQWPFAEALWLAT